jgi:enoyl-CoA hydratase/carnithine racemase
MSVRIEKQGKVWTVVHSRPEAKNAMDPASAEALEKAFLAFDADPEAAVAVLWGEGGAFCAGFEVALWCDLRVMEESAYFGVYCRRWGVPLIDGGTVRLPRIVGRGRALDLILTGRKVTAEEALRINLCEHVVPDGESRQRAEALAQEIARFPQGCMRADRRSVYHQEGLGLREAMRYEWENGVPALAAEGRAGAARFASGKGRGGNFSDI